MVNSNGDLIGTGFSISNLEGRVQVEPSVIFNSTNQRFLVTWWEWQNEIGSSYRISGQLISSDGVTQGTNFTISTLTRGGPPGGSPRVAIDPQTSKFLVVWNGYSSLVSGHYSDILGQLVNADGTLDGSSILISADIDANGEGMYSFTCCCL